MLDMELIEAKQDPLNYENYYKDLVDAFKWVNNPQGEQRIKQTIENIVTDAYQKGQTEVRLDLNKKIEELSLIIVGLRGKYEPKEQDDRGYGQGRYQGD